MVCIAALAVAADDHQLRPGKEVGQGVGVDVLHIDPAKVDLQVGQQRRADLGVEGRHLLVDGLLGPDVAAGPPVVLGDGVEQDGVHVVAHAKGKDAGIVRRGVAHVVDDAVHVHLADGGQAIGEKDEDGGPLARRPWPAPPAGRG